MPYETYLFALSRCPSASSRRRHLTSLLRKESTRPSLSKKVFGLTPCGRDYVHADSASLALSLSLFTSLVSSQKEIFGSV